MAGLYFRCKTGAIALVAATAKTALQIIAASTNKVRVKLIVSFNGTSGSDEPVRVRVLRQTTAIGGSPTTVTPVKVRNGDAGTIQTTAKASAGGSEPTASDVYYDQTHHDQGCHPLQLSFEIEQGDRLGVELTSAVATPNVYVTADCEE